MDWEEFQNKVFIGKQRGRGRPENKMKLVRPDGVEKPNDESKEVSKWTLSEKLKLLEGLKRYNEDVDHLSEWIETKSVSEVESMLSELKEKHFIKRTPLGGTELDEQAPIDQWLKLIRELTGNEAADFSECIPMVFGLISRNEEFGPSGDKDVQWKRVYQYIGALMDERQRLPKLTPSEAAVVLDLMDNLGTSLHQLDDDKQRKGMQKRFKGLHPWKRKGPLKEERKEFMELIEETLSADFSDPDSDLDISDNCPVEIYIGPSTSTSDIKASSSSSRSLRSSSSPTAKSSSPLKSFSSPGTSKQASAYENEVESTHSEHTILESTHTKSTHPESILLENTCSEITHSGSENAFSDSKHSQGSHSESADSSERPCATRTEEQFSDDTVRTIQNSPLSKKTTSKEKAIISHKETSVEISRDKDSSHNGPSDQTLTNSGISNPPPETLTESEEGSKGRKRRSNDGEMNNMELTEGGVEGEKKPVNKFKKPKLFTLNPLCIPASAMAIKKRKTEIV